MLDQIENNKRIAKNTFFLYMRQILTMLVSLYTVRIILDILGAQDYGIYNVVGGVVGMFSFLSGTMTAGTQRFLSNELGKLTKQRLSDVFSVSFLSFIIIITIVLLLSETIGLWFVKNKMNIPLDRLNAAIYTYHLSVASFIVILLFTPYNAAIIALEKMSFYAYISILDAIIKLLIVFILPFCACDNLIVYSLLIFLSTLMTNLCYFFFIKFNFKEFKLFFCKDVNLLFEMLMFTFWNLFGAFANVLRNHGINILINIFFNPIVNTSRAIAFQINNAINNFANNFYVAARPQIFKLFSSKQFDQMNALVISSSKFSFFLMLLIAMPLLLETEFILKLWLKNLPDYSIVFCKLLLINSLIDVFSTPIVNVIHASGKIKNFQFIVSIILLLNLPITYLFYKIGFPPYIAIIISIILSIFSYIPRFYFVSKVGHVSVKNYLSNVVYKVFFVTILSSILPLFFLIKLIPSMMRLGLVSFLTVISVIIFSYLIGCNQVEKNYIYKHFKKILN